MIRALIQQKVLPGIWYCEFAGLSSDEKPDENLLTGSKFQEVDTGIIYLFDEESATWTPSNAGNGKNNIAGATVVLGAAIKYDGTKQTKEVSSVKIGATTLTENTDYVVKDNKETEVGDYTLHIVGIGSYTGIIAKEWSIAKGGEDVIELKDGRDPTRKSLLCKRLGGTYVIVTAAGIGTAIYPVVVDMGSPYVTELKTGADSITITTADDLNSGVDGYELSYREKGAADWIRKTFKPSNTLVLKKLKKGSKYEIKLVFFARTADRIYRSYEYEEISGTVGLKNTLKARGKTVNIKYKKLKKNNQTVKRSKAISVSGAKGTVSYRKISGNKKIKISKKNGRITVKKGLKKGKYKLKVRVTAAGKGAYLKKSKKVTVIVKVK